MVQRSVRGVDVAGVPTAIWLIPHAVGTSEVVLGAIGRLVGEMGSWSWGPLLWVSGLPIGTVDGTEERDSGEDALELEEVDPRQR